MNPIIRAPLASANTTSLSVTVPIAGQSGNVSVTADNVCGSSAPETLAVTVAASASVYAGPDQVVCEGTSVVTLAGEIFGAITLKTHWDWVLVNDNGLFKNGDKLDTDYTFENGSSATGIIRIAIESLVSSVGCDFVSDTMSIIILPPPTASISSVSSVCYGETTTITITGTIGDYNKKIEVELTLSGERIIINSWKEKDD